MKKVYPSAEAALEGLLFDGMTIAAGGFGDFVTVALDDLPPEAPAGCLLRFTLA